MANEIQEGQPVVINSGKVNNRKQAHGLTHEEMEELHYKQVSGEEIETVSSNNAGDKISDPYFKTEFSEYEIPVHEKHIYHVAEEIRQFKTSGPTPEKTSSATLQKYTKEAYEFMKNNHGFDGKIVHILHNPELETQKQRDQKQQGEGQEGENKGETLAGANTNTVKLPSLGQHEDEDETLRETAKRTPAATPSPAPSAKKK